MPVANLPHASFKGLYLSAIGATFFPPLSQLGRRFGNVLKMLHSCAVSIYSGK
jgi:hypothetical protein